MWDERKYKEFINELYSYQDIKFRDFSKSLMPDNKEYELIGIRFPILKKIAKKIAKEDYITYIKLNTHRTFEEILIHGLILGYIKEDINTVIELLKEFMPYINNWALCDSTVANLHVMSKYPNIGIKFVKWCLKHKKTYYKRVGYVILLDYYIEKEYLNMIFDMCNANESDEYYVKMAVAWLISMVYMKYPKETLEYIKNNKLDKWTHNKAIQKIRESRQVTQEEKDMLLTHKCKFDKK